MDAEQRLRMLALEGDEGALWAWQRHLRRAGGDLNAWLHIARRVLDQDAWTQAAQALLDQGEVLRDREQTSAAKLPKLRVTVLGDTPERSRDLLQTLLTIAAEKDPQQEGSGYFRLRTQRRRYRIQLRPNAARDIGSGGVIVGMYSGDDLTQPTADIRIAYHLKTPFIYCILDNASETKELNVPHFRAIQFFHLRRDQGAGLEEAARGVLAALDGHETAAPPLSTCSSKMWIENIYRKRPSNTAGGTRIIGRLEGRPFNEGDTISAWDFGAEALRAEVLRAEVWEGTHYALSLGELDTERLLPGLLVTRTQDALCIAKRFDVLMTFDRQPSLRQDPLLGPVGVVSGEWQAKTRRRTVPGRAQWEAVDRVTPQTHWGRLELAVGVPWVAGDPVELWRGGSRQAVGVVTGVIA